MLILLYSTSIDDGLYDNDANSKPAPLLKNASKQRSSFMNLFRSNNKLNAEVEEANNRAVDSLAQLIEKDTKVLASLESKTPRADNNNNTGSNSNSVNLPPRRKSTSNDCQDGTNDKKRPIAFENSDKLPTAPISTAPSTSSEPAAVNNEQVLAQQ